MRSGICQRYAAARRYTCRAGSLLTNPAMRQQAGTTYWPGAGNCQSALAKPTSLCLDGWRIEPDRRSSLQVFAIDSTVNGIGRRGDIMAAPLNTCLHPIQRAAYGASIYTRFVQSRIYTLPGDLSIAQLGLSSCPPACSAIPTLGHLAISGGPVRHKAARQGSISRRAAVSSIL